jgi:hypothetical protein
MQPPISIAVVTFTADQLQALIEQAVERAMRTYAPIQPPAAPAPVPEARTAFPDRMSRDQAAEYLGLASKTLSVEVCRRRLRIPYVKVGRKVVYERASLDRWLAERRVS